MPIGCVERDPNFGASQKVRAHTRRRLSTGSTGADVMRSGALRIAEGRSVDADRVALVAQAREERVDERFIAEEIVPFVVFEIRRDNGGASAIALLHQL